MGKMWDRGGWFFNGSELSGERPPQGSSSPVFNATSSSLHVKKNSICGAWKWVRLCWRGWCLQLDWIRDDTQTTHTECLRVCPPCGVPQQTKVGQVMLVMCSGNTPTRPHFLLQGSTCGRSVGQLPWRVCVLALLTHYIIMASGCLRPRTELAHTNNQLLCLHRCKTL